MENPLALSLSIGSVIDRIRTSGIYLPKADFDYIKTQLFKHSSIKADFEFKGKVSPKCYKNKHGHFIYALHYETLDSHQPIARFEIGSFIEPGKGETKKENNLKYYLAWELWPRRLINGELRPFHQALDVLLKELDVWEHPPIYSYAHTYKFAKVKYLEIAIEFPNLEPHTFIPWRPRGRVSWIWTNPKTGEKGATYLGLKGDVHDGFAFYPKTKQLLETGQPPPKYFKDYPCTRFESRGYRTGFTLETLGKMKNQFIVLEIADPTKARGLSDAVPWREFLNRAMVDGSAKALAGTTKGWQRTKFIAMLRKAAHPGWNLKVKKQIWDSYLRSVERLSPEAMF